MRWNIDFPTTLPHTLPTHLIKLQSAIWYNGATQHCRFIVSSEWCICGDRADSSILMFYRADRWTGSLHKQKVKNYKCNPIEDQESGGTLCHATMWHQQLGNKHPLLSSKLKSFASYVWEFGGPDHVWRVPLDTSCLTWYCVPFIFRWPPHRRSERDRNKHLQFNVQRFQLWIIVGRLCGTYSIILK